MKLNILLLITMLAVAGFLMSNTQQDYLLSPGEHLINRTVVSAGKNIKEKYNLELNGASARVTGGSLQTLKLNFYTKYPYTKKQLREFLVQSTQELLNQFNEDKMIQNFLKEQQLDVSNIYITIENYDKSGRTIYDPKFQWLKYIEAVCLIIQRT